jgi:hypothetical protein
MERNRKFDCSPFKASLWLGHTSAQARQTEHHSASKNETLPDLPSELNNPIFSPSHFLIPGWQGEGLLSKDAVSLFRLIGELIEDAREQFKKAVSFPQTRKQLIYEEFIEFKETFDLNCPELNSFSIFWNHFSHSQSQFQKELHAFSDSFCLRSVLVYLNKVRFLGFVTQATKTPFDRRDLSSINNLVSKIFIQGSSSQIQCDSLKANQYSWYLPQHRHTDKLYNLMTALLSISVTELNKIFSSNFQKQKEHEANQADNKNLGIGLEFKDDDYSHALSHKSFGLFLNELLITFPDWILEQDSMKKVFACYESNPETIQTKFQGDFLKSLSVSHWLAQENNVHLSWKKIICPDFIEPSYANGEFHKICHELQFLSFLVHFAAIQGHDPLSLICRVVREKYTSNTQTFDQIPLWNSPLKREEVLYKRIVMNLTSMTKTNPHHYLLSRISQEAKSLDRNGILFVMTNQKIFVPSQSDRVSNLLKTFKLEANFCFEHLKGKGEIANYLYVFRKRQLETLDNTFIPSFKTTDKEPCLSFRWSGDLTRFNKFESIVDELKRFLDLKNPYTTPIYQSESSDGISFEFHQDAIFEGKLVSANISKDSTQIAHPNFFKNLTRACVHFGQFFQVESLVPPHSSQSSHDPASILLGLPFVRQERFPLVMIVDHRQPENIRIELINYDLYFSKFEQLGNVYYSYFGLLPKRQDININTFKEFFDSRLGSQIIQFSFNGGLSKLKSKVQSLLVPRFFEEHKPLPEDILTQIELLKINYKELLTTHPHQLKQISQKTFNTITKHQDEHAWQILGLLSVFKTQLVNALIEVEGEEYLNSNKTTPRYTNPFILEPLLKLPAKKIYTENEDIYLDYLISNPDDFLLPLTEIHFKRDADSDFLELHGHGKPILRLYAQKVQLDFIHFIFNSALGTPVSDLIQNCQIPATNDLSELLKTFDLVTAQIKDLLDMSERSITDLLTRQIANSSR